MDENSTANIFDEKLPSADLASAAMIFVLFLTSMAAIIPMISPQNIPAQTTAALRITPALKIEDLREDSGETILLASIKPKPSNSYKPPSKPSKTDFKIKGSHFKFPPFKGKKGEHIFHPIIDKASEQHNIDPALIKAVIMAESSYNPRAVSPRGAVGLMQLMPNTAESLGVANSYNPEQNVQGGTKYLKELIDHLNGDIKLALAAYNAGLARVKKHNGIPPIKDTEYYVHKVYHYYDFYKNQESVQAHQNAKRNKNEIVEDVDEA
jgi:hypothetical protein